MRKVFNLGIGFAFIVRKEKLPEFLSLLESLERKDTSSAGFGMTSFAVLISGRGTNMAAIARAVARESWMPA